MSRLIVAVAVFVVVITAGLFALAGLHGEKPVVRVEKDVSLASLQK